MSPELSKNLGVGPPITAPRERLTPDLHRESLVQSEAALRTADTAS